MSNCEPTCQASCPQAFRRLVISHIVNGGSRISWELVDQFADQEPHEFTLFAGHTANPEADDWVQVGFPAQNTWYLVDDQKRLYGTQAWTHYRVRLVTPRGTYWSAPSPIFGKLAFRDWRLASDMIRKMKLQLRYTGNVGYLLKRKIYGDPCTECLNYQTGRFQDEMCPVCYGTGILGGYYPPMPCSYVEFTEDNDKRWTVDEQRGSIGDVQARVRMLADPLLFEDDVWVDADTDQRWFIRTINSEADVRGVPLVYFPVTIALAEFSHVIYQFPVPRT